MSKTRLPEQKKETFIVIMPALNEVEYIEETILYWVSILSKFPGSVILVVDKSTDGTKDKLIKLRKKYGLLKVIEQKGVGHGNALIHGYNIAVRANHPWIVQADSDGLFSSSDFNKLLEKKSQSSFIIGHRQNREDPSYRIFLTWLISTWILILFGHKIKDPNIPFRLIKRDYLEKLLNSVPNSVFAPNIFLSILAARDGQNLNQVPVIYKTGKKKSSLSKLKLLKASLLGFKELVDFRQNFYQ